MSKNSANKYIIASIFYFWYLLFLNKVLYYLISVYWIYFKKLFEFLIFHLWKLWALTLIFLLQYFLFFAGLFVVLKYILNLKFSSLLSWEFKWRWFKPFLLYWILWYLLVAFFMWLIEYLLLKLWIKIPGFFWQEKVLILVKKLATKWDIYIKFFLFVVVVLIWPIVEEIIFRGFITESLIRWKDNIISIILSAFIFAFIHFEWAVFLNLFIISFWLSYTYWKTRSLIYTIFIHILVNWITFIVMLNLVY